MSMTVAVAIQRQRAKGRVRCRSCEGIVRRDEPYFQVVDSRTGLNVKGERYCPYCESECRETNPNSVRGIDE